MAAIFPWEPWIRVTCSSWSSRWRADPVLMVDTESDKDGDVTPLLYNIDMTLLGGHIDENYNIVSS